MKLGEHTEPSTASLHSNLVIFKYGLTLSAQLEKNLYIPIWLYSNRNCHIKSFKLFAFTFQSGYIQIFSNAFMYLSLYAFTFQSGYIQIQCFLQSTKSKEVFTFQSGYIQIRYQGLDPWAFLNFTFQSGYIQIL